MTLDNFLFKTRIRFSIRTDNIEPDIITQQLNIQPDHFFKKGTVIYSKFSPRPVKKLWNLWAITSPWTVLETETVSHHIEYLKEILLPQKDILEHYKKDERFDLSFWINIKTDDAGYSLNLMENELNFLNRFSNSIQILFLSTDRESILKKNK